MNTQTLAADFTKRCQAGDFEGAGAAHWADDVVSLEPMGDMARAEGRQAVAGKGEWWAANHEVHGATVEGPYVFGDQFAVRFKMDITPRGGERTQMDEIGLYTVRDGKIVEERFLYGTS
ncbi:MAG: nuclear transport factor 2 family protein [Alphaproteobacteria bacterium]|nr:nuclear transport factor 2 family protein [Alphaproteobacteria bacterium]